MKYKENFNVKSKPALIVAIASSLTFLILLFGVLETQTALKYDFLINKSLENLRTSMLNKIMLLITSIVGYPLILVFSAILFFFLIYKRKRVHSATLVTGLLAGFLVDSAIKLLIHRTRPENALIFESTYSFPSAHAVISVIFFSVLIYSFKDNIKSKQLRVVFIFSNVFLLLLISFSRIYLGVHWLSDVLAGLFLGIFIVSLAVSYLKY